MLSGIGASQGYGIGRAVVIENTEIDYSKVEYSSAQSEKNRLHNAIDSFVDETLNLADKLRKSAGEKEAEILEGHTAMIADPFMQAQIEESIDSGCVAEEAVDTACRVFMDMFSSAQDELTRQRATDIKDIRDSILSRLSGVKTIDISDVSAGSVLIVDDLTPSMTGRLNKKNVSAIVTQTGGVTSHSAILARAMGIPAVLSVPNVLSKIANGEMLICDGFKGRVLVNPTSAQVEKYSRLQDNYLKEREALNQYIGRETVTRDGVKKLVFGNIGKPEDVQNVLQNSGEGIGLFRTEFLFMDRNAEPDEEEQYEAYSTVAKAMNGKEVIIRTLDIGGDKEIPYLSVEREENPFLGHRAIRYCLDNKPLFKKQLRAVLRAAALGNIKLMLPLVTSVDEVHQTKKLIAECESELKNEGRAYKSVPLGVMIETPAAALISDILAREVDFFSIGTNDLTGYIMAVDRGNSSVSGLYDIMHPAVLRAIEMTVKNAKQAGIPVGMCGEGAADAGMIPLLIEWGLDEFSVSPSSILQTRKIICEG